MAARPPTPPFTPYWRRCMPPVGPMSWMFVAVARICGRHRPVAIVSSMYHELEEGSLQGYPLVACCRRVCTIFADPANRAVVRAELALAARYYVGEDGHEYFPGPVELPEHEYRRDRSIPLREWDSASLPEFPCIAACLLHGVGLDAEGGGANTRLEPLATVYRDTSVEWGMVVIDITQLDVVRYGIVGFTTQMVKLVSSRVEQGWLAMADGMGRIVTGDYKVMEDLRPRKAMSAAEYMAKFNYEASKSGDAVERLAEIPLVELVTMDLVWPPSPGDDVHPSEPVAYGSAGELMTSYDQAITRLIQETHSIGDLSDSGAFEEVRAIPNYETLLRHHLLRHPILLDGTRSAGQLIRIAFYSDQHLGLEQLNRLSADVISAAIDCSDVDKVTSISLCIESIQETPARLAEVLLRAQELRKIYLLSSPSRESDELSVRVFEELAARKQILSRADVTLAGGYSVALRKRFWLPTRSSGRGDLIQVAPLEVFPAQQMIVRKKPDGQDWGDSLGLDYDYEYIHLGDGLLKPERLATGFLLWLSTLYDLPCTDDFSNPRLFSLSSAPASLSEDLFAASQVTQILAENWAMPEYSINGRYKQCARMRDLVPDGWTIIVSLDLPRPTGTSFEYFYEPQYIRYAFVRALKGRIAIDSPPKTAPGMEELEVVGLKEFLRLKAPDVDPAHIDRRLDDVAGKLARVVGWGPLPVGINPLSVLTQREAADILLESLEHAKEVDEAIRAAMRAGPERMINCYPELLETENGD